MDLIREACQAPLRNCPHCERTYRPLPTDDGWEDECPRCGRVPWQPIEPVAKVEGKTWAQIGAEVERDYVSPMSRRDGETIRPLTNVEMLAALDYRKDRRKESDETERVREIWKIWRKLTGGKRNAGLRRPEEGEAELRSDKV